VLPSNVHNSLEIQLNPYVSDGDGRWRYVSEEKRLSSTRVTVSKSYERVYALRTGTVVSVVFYMTTATKGNGKHIAVNFFFLVFFQLANWLINDKLSVIIITKSLGKNFYWKLEELAKIIT